MTSLAEPYLAVLRAASFSVADEAQLQRQVAAVFDRARIDYQRERVMGFDKRDRLDFWLPLVSRAGDFAGGVALELKVGQDAKAILRQLLRYAERVEVRELIIASTHHSALRLPETVGGKLLHSIQLRAWC